MHAQQNCKNYIILRIIFVPVQSELKKTDKDINIVLFVVT